MWDDSCPWPRRLLHVPSMRSHKWKDGNVYGDHVEPKYNAVSYTRDRWQLKAQEQQYIKSLKVEGISWPIPRIDPEHFSVSDILRLLQVAAGQAPSSGDQVVIEKVDFLWLDVACIDQTFGAPEMASEIGRQAMIFKGANDVVIWLSRQITAMMKQWELGLVQNIDPLCDAINQDQLTNANIDAAQNLFDVFQSMKSDPWFSSLWTLQEAFLCQEAFVLSKEATTLGENDHGHHPYRLKDHFHFLEAVRRVMLDSPGLQQLNVKLGMVPLIEGFGFVDFFSRFPMNLLAASQHRETSPDHRADRVYGIMQIFGFRLGKSNLSADPNHHFSLPELGDELGKALLETFPVMSQLHCHTSEPAVSKAWRIGRHSTIPMLQGCIFTDMKPSRGEIHSRARFGTQYVGTNLYGSFAEPTASFHDLLPLINEQRNHPKSDWFSNIFISLNTIREIIPVMKA